MVRAVWPETVGAMMAAALRSIAVSTDACATASAKVRPGFAMICPHTWHNCDDSTSCAMRTMVATDANGYLPDAVSPESMIASEPSRIAFATSLASARVGRGLRIMESSICVAVITGLPAVLHLRMIIFWSIGTASGDISMPRSPRATIMPSAAAMIASMLAIASGFSILAMTGVGRPNADSSRMIVLQIKHLVGGAHKGKRHPVHPVAQRKAQVLPVFLRDRGDGKRGVGQVQPLVGTQQAAGDDFRDDLAALHRHHDQFQQAVVNQDVFIRR